MKVPSRFLRFIVFICASLLLASSGAQTTSSTTKAPTAIQGSLADPSLNAKVEALLGEMTLDEKVDRKSVV